MDDNNKTSLQCVYELLLQKDNDFLLKIKSIQLNGVTEHCRANLADRIMCEINNKLVEWDINIPSFKHATLNNHLENFQYLLEIIQNENRLNFDKINELYNHIKKYPKDLDKYTDCHECIAEIMDELKNAIENYKMNPDSRIKTCKSLKEATAIIYSILNKLIIDLRSFPTEKTIELHKSIIDSIKHLVKISFVISEYPPKIIKKKTQNQSGTHFNATISSLVESEKLFSSNPFIQVYFLNEENLQTFILTKQLLSDFKIDFKDVKKANNDNNWLIRNMIWNPRTSESKDRKRSDRITNMKAVILFRIKVNVNPYGLAQQFEVVTDLFSDTTVSVVHSNQEVDAHLTLFWDDYFRINKSYLETGKFLCHEFVDINELTSAISNYFLKHTSRGLTPSNIMYLHQKLFTRARNGVMTFQDFSRIPMPDSEHSFGHWIFLIIKLLKVEGTITMWKNDLIDGFITKDAEAHLMDAPKGSFILRFSEKNQKIGVVTKVGNKCNAWTPFSIEECRRQNLPERLMSYEELTCIRNAYGQYINKAKCLSDFIDSKSPDIGYTQRGGLSKLFEGNMYTDDIDMVSDEMIYSPTDIDNLDDIFPELNS